MNVLVKAMAVAVVCAMVDSAPLVQPEGGWGPSGPEGGWGPRELEERQYPGIRKERIGPMEERRFPPWKRSPLPPDYDFENMIPPAKREALYPAKRSPLPPGFKGFDHSDYDYEYPDDENMIPPAKRSPPPFDYAKVRQNHSIHQ